MADGGLAVNDDVGMKLAAVAEGDIGLDDAVGADLDVGSDLGVE